MSADEFPHLTRMLDRLSLPDKIRALDWIVGVHHGEYGPIEPVLLGLMSRGHARIEGFLDSGPIVSVDAIGEAEMTACFGEPVDIAAAGMLTPGNKRVH